MVKIQNVLDLDLIERNLLDQIIPRTVEKECIFNHRFLSSWKNLITIPDSQISS